MRARVDRVRSQKPPPLRVEDCVTSPLPKHGFFSRQMSRQNLRESVENPREGFLVTHCCKKPAFFLDRALDRISEGVRKPMLTVFSLKNPGRADRARSQKPCADRVLSQKNL